jgi:EAL domain-containing protein (putative c-di-GMP-specific phosphodiesterase class I)
MLIDQPGVIPYYQPILSFSTGEPIGFEMLARSRLKGLESPTAMFSAAANLARVAELSCLLRREGVRLGRTLANGRPIFLNTHPAELKNRSTFTSLEELRKEYPDQPITIEIHEKAVTDTSILHDLRTLLTSLDMKLAFDDFGTGESRLLELAEVTPDVVKFDRSLIKDIHQAPEARVQLIARLVRIIHELNSVTVAEGVELPEESAVCRQIGFQAGQGYAFGRPQPIDGLD